MKTLYFECNMGAAGDMLTAALLELVPDKDAFVQKLNALGLDGVEFNAEPSEKCGVKGTHVHVHVHGEEEHSHDVHEHEHHHEHEHEHEHEHQHDHEHHDHHEHHHAGMHDIEHMVEHLNVSDKVRADVLAVYSLIAQAECAVHGKDITEIHFHEVGTMDAVADVTAVCMLIEALSPDKIIASPIHVGSGNVHCAHGILPVPAPATERILRGVPVYGGRIKGELCTPTGAALLKHFVHSFGDMPVMCIEKTGYGMGNKDFEAANCVRAVLGETGGDTDTITELRCNIDDMTPEALGFAQSRIFEAGARDVFTTPIYMKKNRPAVLLTCICKETEKPDVIKAIFAHTTTIGIRETQCARYVLSRSEKTVETKYGAVRVKCSQGYGTHREKPEYDDVQSAAKAAGVPLDEVLNSVVKSF